MSVMRALLSLLPIQYFISGGTASASSVKSSPVSDYVPIWQWNYMFPPTFSLSPFPFTVCSGSNNKLSVIPTACLGLPASPGICSASQKNLPSKFLASPAWLVAGAERARADRCHCPAGRFMRLGLFGSEWDESGLLIP